MEFRSSQNVELLWNVLVNDAAVKSVITKDNIQQVQTYFQHEVNTTTLTNTDLLSLNKIFLTKIRQGILNSPQKQKQEGMRKLDLSTLQTYELDKTEIVSVEEYHKDRMKSLDSEVLRRREEMAELLPKTPSGIPSFLLPAPVEEKDSDLVKRVAEMAERRKYALPIVTGPVTAVTAVTAVTPVTPVTAVTAGTVGTKLKTVTFDLDRKTIEDVYRYLEKIDEKIEQLLKLRTA